MKNIVIHIRKKYLAAVRGGDRAGADVPARAQRDLPRPEAGQHSAGQRGPRQDRGLRDVSRELLQVALTTIVTSPYLMDLLQRGRDQHILRHPALHGAG